MTAKEHIILVSLTFGIEHASLRPKGTGRPVPLGAASKAGQDALFAEHLRGKYYGSYLQVMHPWVLTEGASGKEGLLHLELQEGMRSWVVSGEACNLERAELFSWQGEVAVMSLWLRLAVDAPSLVAVSRVATSLKELHSEVGIGDARMTMAEAVRALMQSMGISEFEPSRHGPNAKVFVNAVVDGPWAEGSTGLDEELFCLATGFTSDSIRSSNGPDPLLIKSQMEESSVRLFGNWRGLALFDSFARLASGATDPHGLWERDYARIHQYVTLLRGFVLDMAHRLDTIALDDARLLEERDRWHAFINEVDLRFVAYKWLPNELYRAMVKGAQLDHEIERVDQRMKRAVQRFKERRARNSQRLAIGIGAAVVILLALIRWQVV
jgi:hypothetical protein